MLTYLVIQTLSFIETLPVLLPKSTPLYPSSFITDSDAVISTIHVWLLPFDNIKIIYTWIFVVSSYSQWYYNIICIDQIMTHTEQAVHFTVRGGARWLTVELDLETSVRKVMAVQHQVR